MGFNSGFKGLTKIHKFIGTLAQEIESFDWIASVRQVDCMKWLDHKKSTQNGWPPSRLMKAVRFRRLDE